MGWRIGICLLWAGSALGLTQTFEDGGSQIRLFAPDWIWQGQPVNVMAVIENHGTEEETVRFELGIPPEAGQRMPVTFAVSKPSIVRPNTTLRLLVATIMPAADLKTGSYPLTVHTDISGRRREMTYSLKVVRGSLVDAGIWSVVLPALVALIWSTVLLFVLPRMSRRGAWRIASPPFSERAEGEAWFKNE